MANTVKMNNGIEIPQLGIGTFTLSPEDAEKAVLAALECGYRHIDTANGYMNERAVGRAMRKSGVPREEIFLTTKLMPSAYKKAEENIDATLRRLDVDYIDLLMLHQPYGNIKAGWQWLEKAVREGKVKSIGVCNFEERDMEKLLSYAKIKPVLIQNECHPFHQQNALRKKYEKDGIKVEAWYPLAHGDSGLMDEPLFAELADKYGKSKIQVILRWHIQKGNIVIPGSKNPAHIKSNGEIFDFELTDDEMAKIAAMDGRKKFFTMPRWMCAIIFPFAKLDYDKQV